MEQLQIRVTAPGRREDPTPSQARSTQCPEEPGRTLPGHCEHFPFQLPTHSTQETPELRSLKAAKPISEMPFISR